MAIKPTYNAGTRQPDEVYKAYREMGMEWVQLSFSEEELNIETMQKEIDRLAAYHLKPWSINCMTLQKDPVIHLNLTEYKGQPADRDTEIAKFIQLIKLCSHFGVKYTSVAWQPVGVKRSDRGHIGELSHGAVCGYCDFNEILSRPNDFDREYTYEEVWDNFAYFLRMVTPACKEYDVQLLLHPNDPPMPSYNGIASLIHNSDGYRKMIELDKAHICQVKFCIGCWIENAQFGDVIEDFKEFQAQGRIADVHFRNISAPLPVFEETNIEDGYRNMWEIMKAIIASGYEGAISPDHVLGGFQHEGYAFSNIASQISFMKGLIYAAERECGALADPTKAAGRVISGPF